MKYVSGLDGTYVGLAFGQVEAHVPSFFPYFQVGKVILQNN